MSEKRIYIRHAQAQYDLLIINEIRNALTSFADCGICQFHHIDYKLIEIVDGCIPTEF